jgi:hypothetical protein
VVVPLGDLVAQLGVAAAADQLDLVCHFGGHGEKEFRAAAGRRGPPSFLLCFFLQVLAGNQTAGQ